MRRCANPREAADDWPVSYGPHRALSTDPCAPAHCPTRQFGCSIPANAIT